MNVFISHSHKDKETVRMIAADLRAQDIQVWIDDDMIAPGEVWADKLSKAIDESDAVIIILSRSTALSKWQTSEIAFAVSAQRRDVTKRVIPVLIDHDAEIPFFLRDRVYCDLSTDENYAGNFIQLLEALRRPIERVDIKRIEASKIEAIQTQREFLTKEIEAQSQKRYYVMSTLLASLVSIIVASLSLLAAVVKIIEWDFVMGFLSGILGAILSLIVFSFLKKKSRDKEVSDAKR